MTDILLVMKSDPEEQGSALIFVDVTVCGKEIANSSPLAELRGSVRTAELAVGTRCRRPRGFGFRHDVPIALAAEPTMPSLLGLDVLRHYSWCFCLSRGRSYVRAAELAALRHRPLELGEPGPGGVSHPGQLRGVR